MGFPSNYNVYDDLTFQQQVHVVVGNETTRLANKKKEIDVLQQNQQRQDFFKRMAVKRKKALFQMFAIAASLAIGIAGLLIVKKRLPFPGWMVTLVIAFLIVLGMVTLFWSARDFLRRDNINFDEVYSSPETSGITNVTKRNSLLQSGDITAAMNAGLGHKCVGAACCATGTTYNGAKCV